MTQCEWCGLITENDKVCSWCGHPHEGAVDRLTLTPQEVASRPSSSRTILWLIPAVIALLALCAFILQPGPIVTADGATLPQTQDSDPANLSLSAANEQNTEEKQTPRKRARYTRTIPDTIQEDSYDAEEELPDDFYQDEGYGSIQVLSATVEPGLSDAGTLAVLGVVTIGNDGDYNVTGYRITLHVGGDHYALTPMSDALYIAPGDQLSIPVMAIPTRDWPDGFVPMTVTVEAVLDGPPGRATGTAYVLPSL